MTDLSEFFGEHSPLEPLLPGFRPRAVQAWMAEAVAEAIASLDALLVEAGTGTGKTFAYLLPALLSNRKTIVSTGTRALQDQLYHRDLPLLSRAIGRPVTTALLKGRANYLCLHRLDLADAVPRHLQDELNVVREWRHRTDTGDRAELTELAETSGIWPYVTSTIDNCLGQQCPDYAACHVVKARRAAQAADLVVVNHHLLLADLAMKESGFVEFLPGVEAVIVDEAHQLPDLAVQFFGVGLGSRELGRIVDETRAATLTFGQQEFSRRIDALDTAVRKLRAAAPRKEGRYRLEPLLPDLRDTFEELRLAIDAVAAAVEILDDDGAGLEGLAGQLRGASERLALLTADDTWDGLRWLDVSRRSLRMNLTPLDVSDTMSAFIRAQNQAWVLTSATLAVGGDFSHFAARLGLGGVTGLTFPSPYAAETNGLVYLPRGLPQPSSGEHTAAMLEAVMPLAELTEGGIFCLFTSHGALDRASAWCRAHRGRLAGRKLLVQGSAPRDELLHRFRDAGNAVLLGTGSFWEGVDVRGRALTVVAIDKLPFTSPSDPLLMARLEFIRREGGNGFTMHQLPQAILALKQGAGRLLRDDRDYGVVVVCDPRIGTRAYGRRFLDSLEPMPVTDSLETVTAFLTNHERQGAFA